MTLRAWLTGALLLLQGADVVLTWRLLSSQGDVVEANPVAVAVLDRHGWAGAVALKVVCTAVAVGCVLHIWRTRPGLGGGLLGGLCGVMLAVVCYSGALLARPAAGGEEELAAAAAALDEQWSHLQPLKAQREKVCVELLAGRVALPEAVRKMAEQLSRHRDGLNEVARSSWPRPEQPDQVAQFLILHCAGRPGAGSEAVRGLHGQYVRNYAPELGPGLDGPGRLAGEVVEARAE